MRAWNHGHGFRMPFKISIASGDGKNIKSRQMTCCWLTDAILRWRCTVRQLRRRPIVARARPLRHLLTCWRAALSIAFIGDKRTYR